MGEHLPYKQRVIGSSPVVPTSRQCQGAVAKNGGAIAPPNGPVAQLVRALACHARGRGFDPHPDRHLKNHAKALFHK